MPKKKKDTDQNFDDNQSNRAGDQNRSMATSNKGDVSSSKRERKPMKKIQRYESNSIDEEEFQDYFTNPIKRKEFDRQRKKQQMREMQNITGFTLGQFGIKSSKAMKEAMPAYPETEEQNINDQQKNYATVSLCCLSVTNPLRNRIIQIVAVNPWFDRFILFVIVVNCFFLALDNEWDLITPNSDKIDFVFLIIYTLEMALKIIAMGFFMRPHSYLRDSWNILDFAVVVLGWVSLVFDQGDISAIKVIRILRPLRTINQIPNMSSLVSTILNSLPIMFDVMILFFFMLIMFGTIATQLLGGKLLKRCMAKIGGEWTHFLTNVDSEDPTEIICNTQADCTSEWNDANPTVLSTCLEYGNPIQGTYSFDNILLSIMNIFQIITLEGWTDMMYIVRGAVRSNAYDIFFVSIVVLGSFVILNLMIAVQASYLDQAFDEESNRISEVQERIKLKKQMQLQQDEDEEEEESDEEEDQDQEGSMDENETAGGRKKSKKKIKKKGIFDFNLPAWFVKLSNNLEKLAETSYFEKFVIVLICCNTVTLASEYYEQVEWLTDVQSILNYFFTVVFAMEMIIKMIGFGLRKYAADNFNLFDAVIVIISIIEMILPDSNSGLSVLRAFRLLRIFKIIKSWDSLRILLSTVLDSLQAITNLGVLILLYMFISALLTKQFFHGDLFSSTDYQCDMTEHQLLQNTTLGFNSTLDQTKILEHIQLCRDELVLMENMYISKKSCMATNNCAWIGEHKPEDKSRYSFSSTGDALISVFIILTGENWNEIMIQVIDQQNSFAVAIFFIVIMIIGNFMLLNLFLAILLKSISEIGDTPEEKPPAELLEGEELEEEEGEEELSEEDEDDGMNDSGGLNSSNSNIEEEFEQIKLQLMELSNNMNGLLNNKDESVDDSSESYSDRSSNTEDRKKQKAKQKQKADKEKAKQAIFSSQQAIAVDQTKSEPQEIKIGSSLFIFSKDNIIRQTLRSFVANSYFAGFIYHMIALNSVLLILDEPQLEDEYQKNTIKLMLTIISIIFVVECVLKIIVQGFYIGNKTYLKDPWNKLDFLIVLFSILTWVLEAVVESSNIAWVRGFRALRALRPLRVVSKNEGIKTVVNSLIQSVPALLNVLLIVLLFLLVFGILGIQLFKGKIGDCNDKTCVVGQMIDGFCREFVIQNKTQCIGDGTLKFIPISERFEDVDGLPKLVYYTDPNTLPVDRSWDLPFNNYDNIMYSMLTFFEISTLEMWPGMMYAAIDSTGLNQVPKLNNNPGISLVFIIYIFFTTFFIMNLFISVIVDKFNEEIKKRQGADNFTDEQKEWVKIQRLLVHTNPKIIPVEPINCFRLQCFKIVQSQAFEYIIMTAIIINTVFLCIDHHDKSPELKDVLDQSNQLFVVFFTGELIIKITAYGFKYYFYVNWNIFDSIIVFFSLIALNEGLLKELDFNVTALRIIRVSRLLRMVKTSEGLRTLLKTLFMSLGNIFNTSMLLLLILFTFSVAGMSLFGELEDNEFLNENVNFRSFYMAMLTLWRAATGESWNGIMHECYYGYGGIAIGFWLLFQLVAFFIFMNVFIAVIGESFNDNQATEDENDILALKKKDIKAFQNTWAKYNPMGELFMRTIRLPDFLRELPPPLGYQGIRIEESKLNKIIFCLNIRDHLGRVYYPEVMWTVFHSIAGMNDDKVLNCEQIVTILKLVKNKYKNLGKKINLDSLCGNKYYRKELTAIKYIQAMKILFKWRNFKNIKKRQNEQAKLDGELDDNKTKGGPYEMKVIEMTSYNAQKRISEQDDEGNHLDQQKSYFHDLSIEPSDDSSVEEAKEPPQRNFENREDMQATRVKNIEKEIKAKRQLEERKAGNNRRNVYADPNGDDDFETTNRNQSSRNRGNANDSESSDNPDMGGITERNMNSQRNKQLTRSQGRDDSAKNKTNSSNRMTKSNRDRKEGGSRKSRPNRYAENNDYDSEEVNPNQVKLQDKQRRSRRQ